MSSTTKDSGELLRIRGEKTTVATLSVYYEAGGETFRMRLRPNSALPEEEHVHRGEALTVVDLARVEEVGGEGVEWFDVTHVPPVVREATRRPVQVPDL